MQAGQARPWKEGSTSEQAGCNPEPRDFEYEAPSSRDPRRSFRVFFCLFVFVFVLSYFIMTHQYIQDLFFNPLTFNRIMLKIKHELSFKSASTA